MAIKDLGKYLKRFNQEAQYQTHKVNQTVSNTTKKVSDKVGYKAYQYSQGPVDALADDVAAGTIKAGQTGLNLMTKKVEPSLGNFYTGRKESKIGVTAAWAVAAGYGSYKYTADTQFAPRPGTVSYGGTAPIMDADGVSSQSQAPTLSATGNMVFGLHQARKG